MLNRLLRAVTIVALVFVSGCTDDILNGGNGSGGDFAISVGAGTTPLYTWTAGPAFSVTLVRTSNETNVVWRVASTASNIASPVRHGTVPQGALETVGTERTLTAGVQYRVSIRLADGRSAFQDFRP